MQMHVFVFFLLFQNESSSSKFLKILKFLFKLLISFVQVLCENALPKQCSFSCKRNSPVFKCLSLVASLLCFQGSFARSHLEVLFSYCSLNLSTTLGMQLGFCLISIAEFPRYSSSVHIQGYHWANIFSNKVSMKGTFPEKRTVSKSSLQSCLSNCSAKLLVKVF